MTKREHLSQDMMTNLKKGTLPADQKLAALNHIGECDFCANAFSECFEEDGLLQLAPDFLSEVCKKIERVPVRYNSNINRKKQERREFYSYSFKVSIAACIALVLLFTGNVRYGYEGFDWGKRSLVDLSGANSVTESLRNLSDKFVDLDETSQSKGGI